jgi:hypothetical protein
VWLRRVLFQPNLKQYVTATVWQLHSVCTRPAEMRRLMNSGAKRGRAGAANCFVNLAIDGFPAPFGERQAIQRRHVSLDQMFSKPGVGLGIAVLCIVNGPSDHLSPVVERNRVPQRRQVFGFDRPSRSPRSACVSISESPVCSSPVGFRSTYHR